MYLYILILIIIYFILYLYKKLNIITIYLWLFLLITLFLIIYLIRNPTELLIPYNLLIENITEKKVFYTEQEKRNIFPTSIKLEEKWLQIREECLHTLKTVNVNELDNVGKKFISNNEEFWLGWKTFPLRMFSKDYEDNMKKCPILREILKSDSSITTAFFSIMEPGKILPSHYGPFKGILRYHLSLSIPPKGSGLCYISVDGETYDWEEGEGILFDETYKHFVENSTPYQRIILFVDIKRSFNNNLLSLLNDFIFFFMSIAPYNF